MWFNHFSELPQTMIEFIAVPAVPWSGRGTTHWSLIL
jgi:hypothetical protein